MKKLQQYARVAILRSDRTEQAKAIRRQYGDASGKCLFKDRILRPAVDGCAATITAKYEHIGCNDILSLAHFPRTIILIEYIL